MPEFMYFYINSWDEVPNLKIISEAGVDEDCPFLSGMTKTFANSKWVEENKIFVSMEWVDQAIFLYVSCPVEWAKKNCPELFNEKNKKQIVSNEDALAKKCEGAYFKPDSTNYGLYYWDDETKRFVRYSK